MSSIARRLSSVVRIPRAPSDWATASATTSQSASACSCKLSGSSVGRPPISWVLAIKRIERRANRPLPRKGYPTSSTGSPRTAHPDGEHHQHQQPAAADTKQAVMHPKHEGLAAFVAPAPVLGDEAQWRAALLQTAVLQRRKLIGARACQRGGAD